MFAHLGPNLQLPWGGAAHGESVQHDLGHWGWSSRALRGSVRRRGRGKLGASGEISGTHLCKVFAHGLGGDAEVVAEGARIASLAGALAVELARNMRCICARGEQGAGQHAASVLLGMSAAAEGGARRQAMEMRRRRRHRRAEGKGVEGGDGPTRGAPRPVKSASSRHGRHDAIGVGRLLLGLGVRDVEASASRVAKLGGIVGSRHGWEGKRKDREPRAGTWKAGSRNAGRAKVCAQRRGSCSLVLLLCSAVEVGGWQREPGGAARFFLCSSARCACAVRRAGHHPIANQPIAGRVGGAGQQPTEAGTERGSVAPWLAWAAPGRREHGGSWPPIVGSLDRQADRQAGRVSFSTSASLVGQTLEQRSGWAKPRGNVEETHGHSAAARELVFIIHSMTLGTQVMFPTCKFESWGRRGGSEGTHHFPAVKRSHPAFWGWW